MEFMKKANQYQMFELTYSGEEPQGSFVSIDLSAEFKNEDENVIVSGFYAGNGNYAIRFLPQKAGVWTYKVRGLIEDSGSIEVITNKEHHGLVTAKGTHFEYEDGTMFYPFGTTLYAWTHQSEALIEQTKETLAKAPFNKVRMCLFPKGNMVYNHNDPLWYPFEKDREQWDVHRPCFEFWDLFESCMVDLDKMGIQVDLILFHPYDAWGFSKMKQEDNLIYLDYLMRRFSAYPNIWWSIANEYDMVFNKTQEDWEEIEVFVARHDPYHHLLSNHQWLKAWDFSRDNITHVCHQTKFLYRIPGWLNEYKKPVMIDECCYEGNIPENWGNLSAFEMVNRFWITVVHGGYCTHGDTYLDKDEILWWAKGGRIKGESVERIAFLKEIVYSLPGPIEPISDIKEITNPNNAAAENDAKYALINQFKKAVSNLPPVDHELLRMDNTPCIGHVGDNIYITYFEHHCTAIGVMDLPEDRKYSIDIIDVWNMTRNNVMKECSGKTIVNSVC